jgi:uncharacterized protein with ParB-like and HNH nuclease domain
MEKPIPLDRLFEKKIFRIPDYQRGYAWQEEQLKNFWEDLINLKDERSHYTGVLTLSRIKIIPKNSKENWLAEDSAYSVFNVVDGQQRLTTFVIFIQALVDFFKSIPENKEKNSDNIYVTETSSIAEIEKIYLFKINPISDFRTYKFGYTDDNPSQEYLRYKIFSESGSGNTQETFYTLNLGNAKEYFSKQIAELHRRQGVLGLTSIYKKLTRKFLFNEYTLEDEFDVFVAFETMNNRGKKLSDLELLKNRLIYLTTLYSEDQLDEAGRKVLRDDINSAWKEVYHQIGKNKKSPLNDDDFLRAHWISYFKYSRDTGRDYAKFLLDKHFTPQNVHELIEIKVTLEQVDEQRSDDESEDQDDSISTAIDEVLTQSTRLNHIAIKEYVDSLKESVGHWFNSFHPHLANGMSDAEKKALDRLNRIGMGYFRPLVMVALNKTYSEVDRISLFNSIERFIFLAFRLGTNRSNYRSSEFYIAARALNHNETTLDEISKKLNESLVDTFNKDHTLRIDDFFNLLEKKFTRGNGYYDWSGLRYTLYEYEQSLLENSRGPKVEWADFLKSDRDRISIEHVFPQTPSPGWQADFKTVDSNAQKCYGGSIGNLLLLSMSINASLQNDSFENKKQPKYVDEKKVRNGYADGSHSEIEVAQNQSWGPTEIRDRGIKILKFMEIRWKFELNEKDRERLLFLPEATSAD